MLLVKESGLRKATREEKRKAKQAVKRLMEILTWACLDEEYIPIDQNFRFYISRSGKVYDSLKNRFCNQFISKSSPNHKGYYAVNLYGKLTRIHRLLGEAYLENPNNYPFIDHIDQNPLNNALSNLRWASGSMNTLNKRKKKNASSRYMGVTKTKTGKGWRAMFKQDYIGYFLDEEQAARAFDAVAKKNGALHLNFPQEESNMAA